MEEQVRAVLFPIVRLLNVSKSRRTLTVAVNHLGTNAHNWSDNNTWTLAVFHISKSLTILFMLLSIYAYCLGLSQKMSTIISTKISTKKLHIKQVTDSGLLCLEGLSCYVVAHLELAFWYGAKLVIHFGLLGFAELEVSCWHTVGGYFYDMLSFDFHGWAGGTFKGSFLIWVQTGDTL